MVRENRQKCRMMHLINLGIEKFRAEVENNWGIRWKRRLKR